MQDLTVAAKNRVFNLDDLLKLITIKIQISLLGEKKKNKTINEETGYKDRPAFPDCVPYLREKFIQELNPQPERHLKDERSRSVIVREENIW